MKRVILIDNRDSFVFNLMEAFQRLGAEVAVVRNDVEPAAVVADAAERGALVVLSPGPGRPRDAGNLLGIVTAAKARVPVFGVCLGHQAILEEAGATVERAPELVHGRASLLAHEGGGFLQGLASPLAVARYHSLCVRAAPARFTVHAALGGMVMAFSDPVARQSGVQFHPESILTPAGDRILNAVLEGV